MNGRPWSQHDFDELARLYPHLPTVEVAARMGRGVSGIYAKAQLLGLTKSEEFLQSDLSGRLIKGRTRANSIRHQYAKGHVPANKGLRRPGWAPGRMATTQFKKGHMAGAAVARWKPVGTIMADPDGYLRLKVRERIPGAGENGWRKEVWPLLHHHIWESNHGPIPTGHVVVFRDGDRANCVLENLELITRGELAKRNQMWNRYPPELAQAIQLNGALKRKIRRLTDGTQQK